MRTLVLLILISIASTCLSDEQKLPPVINLNDSTYQLCKFHTVRKALVIKVAHVGLYLTNCDATKDVMEITDKLVRFKYLVDIKSDFFKQAAESYYIKNLTNESKDSETSELQTFNSFYQDMESEQYYDLYLKQGQQLSLYKNQTLLGSSQNPQFSKRYFSIWFGEYPAIKKLKKAFLPNPS